MFYEHIPGGFEELFRVVNIGTFTPEICWWLEIRDGGVRLREKQRKLFRMKALKSRLSVRSRE